MSGYGYKSAYFQYIREVMPILVLWLFINLSGIHRIMNFEAILQYPNQRWSVCYHYRTNQSIPLQQIVLNYLVWLNSSEIIVNA